MNGLQMKYFVLNPTKKDSYGAASREAILQYANVIRHENPVLAQDLIEWERSIRESFLKSRGD